MQNMKLPPSEIVHKVIAVVGMAGSGKSVLARHLVEIGYTTIRFGGYIIAEVIQRGLEVNPENERIVREDMRKKGGMDVCAKLALPEIKQRLKGGERVAIDGLYSFSEYETLTNELNGGVILVAVFTSKPIRYSRLAKRAERPFTPQEARERDFKEIKNIEKGGPIALADFTLLNDGSPEDLIHGFDVLLERIDSANE